MGKKLRFGDTDYRRICFRYHEHKCVVCGESNVIEIHHYDHNHSNNDPTNLIPLCGTHHGYMHSKFRHLIEEVVKSYHELQFDRLPLLDRIETYDETEENLW